MTITDATSTVVESHQGDTIAYNASFERLRRLVNFSDATIATTLPRGGLQIIQPRQTDPARMRLYSRQMYSFDAPAWLAMASGQIVRLGDLIDGTVHGDGDGTKRHLGEVATAFRDGFLRPFGLEYYVAVPLVSPLLGGYPGVLHVYRTSESGNFSDKDLDALREVASDFDEAHGRVREAKRFKRDGMPLDHHLPHRVFGLLADGTMVFPHGDVDGLDDVLRHNLIETAKQRFGLLKEAEGDLKAVNDSMTRRLRPTAVGSNADRLLLPDRLGDCWAFRMALFPGFPAITGKAIGEETIAFVSHQPDCESWSSLRPSDFAADDEVARLVPALQFMQENFADEISLKHIAKTVHLSPFHFHRRFTDLLGITPKHYLYDCQVAEAKRRLAARDMDLKDIAASCGFAHQSHFTSRFKQATGLTPTQWRRLAGEAGQA